MMLAKDLILFALFKELYEFKPYGFSDALLMVVFLDFALTGLIFFPLIVWAFLFPFFSRPGFKSI